MLFVELKFRCSDAGAVLNASSACWCSLGHCNDIKNRKLLMNLWKMMLSKCSRWCVSWLHHPPPLLLIDTHQYSLITHHHISPPAQPTWPCTPCLPCLPWSHCVTGGCLWCCWWCWCWWLSSVSRGWQVTGVWCVSAPAPLVTAPHPGSTALPPARTTLHTLRDEYSLLSHTCNMFPHTQLY